MTNLRQAATLALEWANNHGEIVFSGGGMEAVGGMNAWAQALRTALEQPEPGPTCPECKAAVLYECVACSSNNYPPKPEQEPDRRALQAAGTHPAPCARHCEAKAFEIEIRSLKSALRRALKQPEQEPTCPRCGHVCSQRPWQGLTDEQKQCLVTDWFDEDWAVKKALWLLDDYEAKLKERNT
jgi:hypothetical protein